MSTCSPGPARERTWSPYQRAIFDDVATGAGHSVVVARAGSGKSTTIVKSFDHVPTGARPGDFVLSRKNAPLVSLFFRFVAKGVPVKVAGRDVGARIADLVRRSNARDVEMLLHKIAGWRLRELARLAKQDPPGEPDAVDDMAECITILAEGAASVGEVEARINDVFAEVGDDKNLLILSSTHKAKGLERDRVWMLDDTYRNKPSVEEDNLWYVAVTRAKRELYLVSGIGGRK